MYKMVVVDLDGTLLNDKKQVSKRNAEVIKKIHKEKGVTFVIATGRDINYVSQVIGEIRDTVNQYIIASNGAIIKDNSKDEYMLKNYIDKTEVLKIIDICREKNLEGLFQTYDEKLAEREQIAKRNPDTKLVEDLKKYYLENGISTTSMVTLCGSEKDLKEMKQEIKLKFSGLDTTDICDFLFDMGEEVYQTKYIDVMKKGSSKANAIKILADYLHINKEEIVVMGDGANDISMFEMSGYKVAMENGKEELKKRADYITVNNNQDGVAKALEEIFNKGE